MYDRFVVLISHCVTICTVECCHDIVYTFVNIWSAPTVHCVRLLFIVITVTVMLYQQSCTCTVNCNAVPAVLYMHSYCNAVPAVLYMHSYYNVVPAVLYMHNYCNAVPAVLYMHTMVLLTVLLAMTV